MTETLEAALRRVARDRWYDRRCYATNTAQSRKAIVTVGATSGTNIVERIKPDHIRQATAAWYTEGLSPATINKRLNCLSALGVNVEGCRVREPKVLKWWLRPEDEEAACAILRGDGEHQMAALVAWTTRTGLRIEESLRLTWDEVSTRDATVTVPGLKTHNAQATLPLGSEALAVITGLVGATYETGAKVFGLTYEEAHGLWQEVRVQLGVQGNPTSTLKALRRSAARYLHITKGMPLDMVRTYLRHEDIETTLGYLRLTGGYGTEEMRKWL